MRGLFLCAFSPKTVLRAQSYSSLNLQYYRLREYGRRLRALPKRRLCRDMRNFRIALLSSLIGSVLVMAMAQSVSANSILLVGTQNITGAGFGHLPRALTIHSTGGPHNTSESGCIAPGLIAGHSACANTLKDVGGDEQNPIKFPKQAAPTVSSLGITSGNQIGILFDAIQPQNKKSPPVGSVTINDLTLKLYNGSSLIFSVSGTFGPLGTNPGNGTTDYLFGLDSAAVTAFDIALGKNFSDTIALDSTISFPSHSAGPDSYLLFNNGATPPSPTPEPTSFVLLGSCIAALVAMKALWKA
jgi:hypothetical protein